MTVPPNPNQPQPNWALQPGGQQPGWGPPGGPPPTSGGTNGFAIAALICAFLCWPLGLIFGFVAKSQIKQRGQGGGGLATAAIIISIVWIVVYVALIASGHGTFSFHVGSDGSSG